MSAFAQHIEGNSQVNISLAEGDQLLFNATSVFEDAGDGVLLGELLVDGINVQAAIVNPISAGGISSLDFSYAYSASTSQVLDFEIYSPSDSFSDSVINYMVVSGSASGTPITIEGTVSVDNMGINLLGGILIFSMVVAFLAFFFKKDSWI